MLISLAMLNGFHGDASRMYCAGTPSVKAKKLVDATYRVFDSVLLKF